jgi:hypothetical protein
MQMQPSHLNLPADYLTLPGLGQPIEVHRLARWRLWIRAAVIALLLAGTVPMPFLARAGAMGDHGLWYAVAGMFLFFAVLFAVETYFRATKTVVLYENGLAHGSRNKVRGWRWDQIEALTFQITRQSVNFIPVGTSHKYTLDMTDGERLVLDDNVSGIKAVGEHVREKVTPLIYERYAQALNRGENVDFGPIRLNLAQGIWDRDRLYAWGDIDQVGAGKGYFIIEPKKGSSLRRTAVLIGDIPNFDVLMALIAEAMPPGPE